MSAINLKPHYPVEVTIMPYPWEYKVPKFQKLDGQKGKTKEHVVRFFGSMGFHAHDTDLFLGEFSKSLTDRAYTRYINLKPCMVHDWEHLVFVQCQILLYRG